MVWFQCEDCGENLKKPKLPNHFRCCSAFKLSCIDCGVTFDQNSVQAHNQCITESEKYGPKGQGKANTPAKNNNGGKPKPEVDINVGLTSRPPWFCSLCNTSATSQQTLMLHAEGKKHRAKARAFHASKQPPKQTEEPTPTAKTSIGGPPKEEIVSNKDDIAEAKEQPPKDVDHSLEEGNGSVAPKKKRKHDASENGDSQKNVDGDNSDGLNSGEVIQAKKKKSGETNAPTKKTKDTDVPENGHANEVNVKKIKWKKLIKSILKSNPDGALKMKKLQKLVLKSLKDSHPIEDEAALKETLIHKISSSSKFVIDEKIVRLAVKE